MAEIRTENKRIMMQKFYDIIMQEGVISDDVFASQTFQLMIKVPVNKPTKSIKLHSL